MGYWIVVNLTPFPIKAKERHKKIMPYATIILPGESCHLPCSAGNLHKSFRLSTSMSRPYAELWSHANYPGELLLGKIGLVEPYMAVRKTLTKHFQIHYSPHPAGHIFELTYIPRVSQDWITANYKH